MTAKLHVINPRKDRHREKAKTMIEKTCDAIETHKENGVVGFVIMAWDNKGRACTHVDADPEGIINAFNIPTYAHEKILSVARGMVELETTHG